MANRRQVQAEATRVEIVDAARELFLARGYIGTSLSAVAALAGVAVQTIYNSIGNKASLLSEVLDQASAGPEGPRTVAEFMQDRAESDPTRDGLIRLLADWLVEVNERSFEVTTLIRQTAAVYPEVAALERKRASRRLANYGLAAASVAGRGGLSTGLSESDAAAGIWSIGHPQVYASLVREGGWSRDAYRDFVYRSLARLLA